MQCHEEAGIQSPIRCGQHDLVSGRAQHAFPARYDILKMPEDPHLQRTAVVDGVSQRVVCQHAARISVIEVRLHPEDRQVIGIHGDSLAPSRGACEDKNPMPISRVQMGCSGRGIRSCSVGTVILESCANLHGRFPTPSVPPGN